MTEQRHPQRCDICANRKGHFDIPFCDFWDKKIPITKYGVDLISHIGCASHSSHPAPAANISAKVKEIREMAALTQQLSAEHDAAIRKDEREKVIKELEIRFPLAGDEFKKFREESLRREGEQG